MQTDAVTRLVYTQSTILTASKDQNVLLQVLQVRPIMPSFSSSRESLSFIYQSRLVSRCIEKVPRRSKNLIDINFLYVGSYRIAPNYVI